MVGYFWGVTFSIYSEGLYGGVFVSTFGVLELYTSLEVLVYPLFFSVKSLAVAHLILQCNFSWYAYFICQIFQVKRVLLVFMLVLVKFWHALLGGVLTNRGCLIILYFGPLLNLKSSYYT